jgi:starch synthase
LQSYDEELSHWIEAGSDVFLMPSRYEPCGLNQMYSQRYGTVPVVRRTGGLADTVVNWDAATQSGTGFVFDRFDAQSFYQAVERAFGAWRDQSAWKQLMLNGMSVDYSWERRIGQYVELYHSLASVRR